MAAFMSVLVLFLWMCSSSLGYIIEIRSHTEHELGLTCWTCPNKTDNEACNNWAPDKICPIGATVCKTVHRINILTRRSVVVGKTCALGHECTMAMVGCHDTSEPGILDCISCCDSSYCNEAVPDNWNTALKLTSLTSSNGSTRGPMGNFILLLALNLLFRIFKSINLD